MQREYYYVFISAILSGFILYLAQVFANYGLSIAELSIYPYFIIIPILFPLILFVDKYKIKKEHFWYLVLYGLIGALVVVAQFLPLFFNVPIAIITTLLYTSPIWTTLFGKLFLNESITRIKLLGLFLALIGIIILINPFSQLFINSIYGLLFALLAGIFLSIWFTYGGFLSKKGVNPITSKFSEIFFMTLIFIIVLPIVKLFIINQAIVKISFNYPINLYLLLIFLGLCPQLLGHLLYLSGVKVVSVSTASIIFLIAPIVAALLGWLLLSQQLTFNIVIGGLIILLANLIVIKYGETNE